MRPYPRFPLAATTTLRRQPHILVIPLVLLAAFAASVVLTFEPALIVPITGLCALLVLTTMQDHIEPLFLTFSGILLLGYIFQGRGFAYVGVPPLYVGEMVMLLGFATLAITRVKWKLSILELWLLAFMALGAIHTIPYYGTWGMDAVRDAATWYYISFALIISLLLTESRLQMAIRMYSYILPLLVAWMVVMPVLVRLVKDSLPHFPGSPLPIISVMKPGDRSIVLAGLAAFVLTGLYQRTRGRRAISPVVFWSCWFSAAVMVASSNRGGMLSMAIALIFLLLLQPTKEWIKPVAIGAALVSLLLVINPTIDIGRTRTVSATQITTNIMSIFSDDTDSLGGVQGTKEWRLQWWGDIYADTVEGADFWHGKGFGINLATEYGYHVDESKALRSPHNIHMTILARMGVPGLVLWAGILVTFAVQMLQALISARRAGDTWHMQVIGWLFAIWLASLVNASFDVFLEGPQGAIPFWCAFGAGLATLRFTGTTDTSDKKPSSSQARETMLLS